MSLDIDLLNKLKNFSKKDVDFYSLHGKKFICKCVHVYDGDTIHVIMYVGDNFYKYRVRLNGIDTSELKGSNSEEKNKAVLARDFLKSELLGKIVTIICDKYDKYGRLLGDIFIDDININQVMIQKGYAVAYFGGKKELSD